MPGIIQKIKDAFTSQESERSKHYLSNFDKRPRYSHLEKLKKLVKEDSDEYVVLEYHPGDEVNYFWKITHDSKESREPGVESVIVDNETILNHLIKSENNCKKYFLKNIGGDVPSSLKIKENKKNLLEYSELSSGENSSKERIAVEIALQKGYDVYFQRNNPKFTNKPPEPYAVFMYQKSEKPFWNLDILKIGSLKEYDIFKKELEESYQEDLQDYENIKSLSEISVIKKYIKNILLSEAKKKKGSLHHWFKGSKSKEGKPGWVQADGSPCANEPGEKKTPKCFSSARLKALKRKGKKGKNLIAAAVRRKRKEDPGQQKKSGGAKPTYVKTFAKGKKNKNYVKAEPGLKESVQILEKKTKRKKDKRDIPGKGSGKKDACYHKVKSRYKVWPSAYASGALVKCRKVGAKNWGNKSKKNESLENIINNIDSILNELNNR